MSARSFLDTNVLVYTDDHDAPDKRVRAMEILEQARRGWGVVSTQVLQEYFVASTRKLAVPAEVARRKVELASRLDTVIIETSDVLGAIDLHRLHGFAFWGALIVRAAQRAGCSVLLSEDFQGRDLDGLRIVNPFAND